MSVRAQPTNALGREGGHRKHLPEVSVGPVASVVGPGHPARREMDFRPRKLWFECCSPLGLVRSQSIRVQVARKLQEPTIPALEMDTECEWEMLKLGWEWTSKAVLLELKFELDLSTSRESLCFTQGYSFTDTCRAADVAIGKPQCLQMMIIFPIRATRIDKSASRGVNALRSAHARPLIACLSYIFFAGHKLRRRLALPRYCLSGSLNGEVKVLISSVHRSTRLAA